jgi:hypothetical protein
LTKRKSEDYVQYIDRIINHPDKNISCLACLVKLADLEDNMDWTRLNELRQGRY